MIYRLCHSGDSVIHIKDLSDQKQTPQQMEQTLLGGSGFWSDEERMDGGWVSSNHWEKGQGFGFFEGLPKPLVPRNICNNEAKCLVACANHSKYWLDDLLVYYSYLQYSLEICPHSIKPSLDFCWHEGWESPLPCHSGLGRKTSGEENFRPIWFVPIEVSPPS